MHPFTLERPRELAGALALNGQAGRNDGRIHRRRHGHAAVATTARVAIDVRNNLERVKDILKSIVPRNRPPMCSRFSPRSAR